MLHLTARKNVILSRELAVEERNRERKLESTNVREESYRSTRRVIEGYLLNEKGKHVGV
jgi:hypothetical protein